MRLPSWIEIQESALELTIVPNNTLVVWLMGICYMHVYCRRKNKEEIQFCGIWHNPCSAECSVFLCTDLCASVRINSMKGRWIINHGSDGKTNWQINVCACRVMSRKIGLMRKLGARYHGMSCNCSSKTDYDSVICIIHVHQSYDVGIDFAFKEYESGLIYPVYMIGLGLRNHKMS